MTSPQENIARTPPQGSRLLELDLAKGSLVILMLIYHTASIAPEYAGELSPITLATSFLHFIFVFITGFLCGWLYWPRIKSGSQSVRKRLAIRALKIFAIFVVANLALYAVGVLSWQQFLAYTPSPLHLVKTIFLRIDGDIFGFEVLLFIAAFLAVASVFIQAKWRLWQTLAFALLALLSSHSTMALYLTFGIAGMVLGYLSVSGYLDGAYRAVSRFSYLVIAILPIYLLFRSQIFYTLMDITSYYKLLFYPIDFAIWMGALTLILKKGGSKTLQNIVIKLGAYTLLAYLLQMLVLRVGYRAFASTDMNAAAYYVGNLIFGTVVVVMLIYLADIIRRKSPVMNRLYTFVFS